MTPHLARTFRRPLSSRRRAQLGIIAVFGLIALWGLIAILDLFPQIFFPSPREVFRTLLRMFLSEGFGIDVAVSSSRIAAAFLASALLAVPLGVAMSCFRWADALISPLVDFVRYVPVPALLPLFILWTGIGEGPKFLVLFVGTFFQLVLLIKDDADDVPEALFDLARTMGATPFQLVRDVLLPATAPMIYDRLRVTLGWCWTYLVIAELISVRRGVGYALKEAQRFNASDRMFVAFLVLGAIGLVTDVIARFGFRKLFPYLPENGAH